MVLLGGVLACTLGGGWLVRGGRPGNDEPQLPSVLGVVTAIIAAEVTVMDQLLLAYVLLALVASAELGIDTRQGSTVAVGLTVATRLHEPAQPRWRLRRLARSARETEMTEAASVLPR